MTTGEWGSDWPEYDAALDKAMAETTNARELTRVVCDACGNKQVAKVVATSQGRLFTTRAPARGDYSEVIRRDREVFGGRSSGVGVLHGVLLDWDGPRNPRSVLEAWCGKHGHLAALESIPANASTVRTAPVDTLS